MQNQSGESGVQLAERPKNLPGKLSAKTSRILHRRSNSPHGLTLSSNSSESHFSDTDSQPSRTSHPDQNYSSLPEAVDTASIPQNQQPTSPPLSINRSKTTHIASAMSVSTVSSGPISQPSPTLPPIASTPPLSETTFPAPPARIGTITSSVGSSQAGTITSSIGSSQAKSPFTPPITAPPRKRPSQILLINPSSTLAVTNSMLATLRPILPPQLELVGYTAPYPAPTASESTVDALLSCEVILRDLVKHSTNNGETVQNFDALLVASYGKHPLIDALRESFDVPVIGIMEGSLYISRMLGARIGIITTNSRKKIQIDDAVRSYGLEHFYVGCEAINFSTLEVVSSSSSSSTTDTPGFASTQTPEELAKRVGQAAKNLAARGADTLILGSEAFSTPEICRAAKNAIREEDGRRVINVIDSVEAGMLCLNTLVGMGMPTSKKGLYQSERGTRRARAQNWL